MRLDFNFEIKDLSGKDIPGQTAGKLIAQVLGYQNKGNSIKLYDWALKLWNGTALEIDKTDAEVLYAIVEASEFLTIISKVPIMKYIKSVQENE